MSFAGKRGCEHVRPDNIGIDRLFEAAIDQLMVEQFHEEVQRNGISYEDLQNPGVVVPGPCQ